MSKPLVELAVAIVGRAISAFGVLAISIVLSRQLSLAEAGSFFTGFTVLMGTAIFARAGQELRLIRSVARRSSTDDGRADLCASLKIVAGISLSVCLPFFVAWSIARAPSPLTLIWLPLVPTAISNVTASHLKGAGRGGLGALSEVGSTSLATSCWFIAFPAQSAVDAWIVLSAASWAVAAAWLVGATGARRFKSCRHGEWGELVHDARHLWLVSVLSYIAQWGVLVVVMIAMTQDAVAVLNALLRLLAPLQFAVLTLDLFLAPRFARKSAEEIIRTRRRGVFACLALVAPYAILVLVWPETLLSAIYGTDYGAYGLEMRILIAGILLQIFFGANGILLNMLSEDLAMTVSVVLRSAAAMFLQLPLLWVPSLWVACLALSASLLLQSIYLRRATAIALRQRSS